MAQMDPIKDYPLGVKRKDLVKTPKGKTLDEITIKAVMNGEVTFDELRITPSTLEYQAQIGEAMGRKAMAWNLRRAAELTAVPDEKILSIYEAMRPFRSSKEDLMAIASELDKFGAKKNAVLVREAADVYEKRGVLKKD